MRLSFSTRLLAVGLIALLTAACASLLLAAEAAKKVRVEARRVVVKKIDGNVRLSTLSSARIYQEDAAFSADNIEVRSEGDVHEFTCTGTPVYTDPETRATADKVIAYSTPRRAEFIHNVRMVSTPKAKPAPAPGKPAAKPADKNDVRSEFTGAPTTLTCETMSYDYAQKRSVAKDHVVVVQKQRTVWADEGVYDQKLELITLRGHVRLQNTGEEELKELKDADTVTVSLENDWIDIVAAPNGLIEMNFDVKDEQPAGGAKKPADAPPPATAPKPDAVPPKPAEAGK